MDIKQVIQRVPGFASQENFTITELTGGITNKNYKITTSDGEAFVLRLGGNETKYLGIDRQVEYDCSRLAAHIGVAPEPIAFIAPEAISWHASFLVKVLQPKKLAQKKISGMWLNP